MNKKMSKRQKDLKSKLMAAICMLLVSSIMMVSTTYAWFTLSTAPEVTGISTAVGANGNLEMALLPTTGDTNAITSESGDSNKLAFQKNVTWGNLVDLSDSAYGLDKIQLYPSELNVVAGEGDAKDSLAAAILKTPAYGADGRVSNLLENTFTGIYEEGSFTPGNQFGVRAVGTASGMTDRQLSYRNASSAASTAASKAAQLASQSLVSNGGALADIAIKKGTNDNPTFTQTEIAALKAIVNDLQKEGGVLDQIEKAYMQYILAFAASKVNTAGDAAWSAVKNLVEADGADLKSVIDGLADAGFSMPDALTAPIAHFNDFDAADVDSMVEKVADAKSKLDALTGDSITWTELSPALTALAEPNAMLVNNIKVGEIMKDDNMSKLVNSVAGGAGLVVTMATGGGIYADIADQSGDYSASISIQKVVYGGLELGPLNARMNTATTVAPPYLTAVGTAVVAAGAPESAEGDGAVPISDMFGYIIDMAFRTNAADSSLLLQVEAADRIYESNKNGVEQKDGQGNVTSTMGGGATMTFTSTTNSFGNDKVLKLMDAIRIVFFDTGSKEILAQAKLNTAEGAYETTADGGIKAYMQLYTVGSGTTKQIISDTVLVESTSYTVYYSDAEKTSEYCRMYTDADGTEHWGTMVSGAFTEGDKATLEAGIPEVTITGNATEIPASSNELMPLTQNTAHKLSVLVYLDGNKVTNADVAATATTSVTGTMNLQFASSANLTPMDYTPLKEVGGSGSGSNTETTYTVTIDGTASTAATPNTAYTFTLAEGKTLASIKVGEATLAADTDYTVSGQSVTIKAEKVTGAIVITTA